MPVLIQSCFPILILALESQRLRNRFPQLSRDTCPKRNSGLPMQLHLVRRAIPAVCLDDYSGSREPGHRLQEVNVAAF